MIGVSYRDRSQGIEHFGRGTIRCDVIVAADCCYMPWLHAELLDSIDGVLLDICYMYYLFCLGRQYG
jgi:hypothetical protein